MFVEVWACGAYDLESMRHCYVSDLLQLDPEMVIKHSPIFHTSHFGKPFDILVGDDA